MRRGRGERGDDQRDVIRCRNLKTYLRRTQFRLVCQGGFQDSLEQSRSGRSMAISIISLGR